MVLFIQNVFEINENLPYIVSRTLNNAGIVVATESLENINVTWQFSIGRKKVYDALYWFVANNLLYKNVTIDKNVRINEEDTIRVKSPVEIAMKTNNERIENVSAYTSINDFSRILRATWHQGNCGIFTSGFAGVQCCAILLSNILRAWIISPQHWSTNSLNLNMIIGDQINSNIRFQTKRNFTAYPIKYDVHLLVRKFNVIKDKFLTFSQRFQITFDEEPRIYGSLNDQVNQTNFGYSLRGAFKAF